MKKEKPSATARKVALNIITLGAKPGMEKVLPAGIVDSTARLLVESGAVSATGVRWSCSPKLVSVYKAFGEPWQWSISPQKLTQFLKETGWIDSPELIEAKDKYGIEYFGLARKS